MRYKKNSPKYDNYFVQKLIVCIEKNYDNQYNFEHYYVKSEFYNK